MIVNNGYIIAIDKTDNMYDEIISALAKKPSAPEGYFYCLKTDLTWELCELPPEEDVPVPPTPEELLSRLEEIL